MTEMLLLDPVQVLQGPGHAVEIGGAALFRDGRLEALGDTARTAGRAADITAQDAAHQLLAPCLVDAHSFLHEPFQGQGRPSTASCVPPGPAASARSLCCRMAMLAANVRNNCMASS